MTSGDLLVGSYDYRLLAVSVLIFMVGAPAVLNLASRVIAGRRGGRLAWLIGGGAASGINTWSMHYTGMQALILPVPVLYHWPTALLSFLPAFLTATLALFVLSRSRMGWLKASAAGILLGGGISALHYTGMAAERVPGMHHYAPPLLALSVALAMLLSAASLRLIFIFRASGGRHWKVASVLLMGAANPVMHYTAMAGTTFTYSAVPPDLSHAVLISSLGTAGIIAVPLMVLGVAMLTSLADRLQKERALLHELFEQGPQAVALAMIDSRIVRVNREFTRIFGYSSQEAEGRRLNELIVPEESQAEYQTHAGSIARWSRVDAKSVRQRKDGSRLHVSIVGVPVSLPDGQIAAYAIYRDITEAKRAEEELHRSFDQLRALNERLETVREEERTRVAREIHDELGQALTAIKIDLTSLMRGLPAEQEQPRKSIEALSNLVDETIRAVRRISTELRPGILDDLGLVAALEWAAEEFQARMGIQCRVSMPDADIAMDPGRATALFRIVQETLTNVARHASATEVSVGLAETNGDLLLEVHDNGKGFDQLQLATGRPLGILGMRERALLLGGELTIISAPGKGTTVRVRIPKTNRE